MDAGKAFLAGFFGTRLQRLECGILFAVDIVKSNSELHESLLGLNQIHG